MPRTITRGPLVTEPLSVEEDRLVVHALRRAFRDGTGRVPSRSTSWPALTALGPRPRTQLVRHHGAVTPNGGPMDWMQRLRRVFDIDLSVCPRCGGAVCVLAVTSEPAAIAAILAHVA